jgi:hypothetical protein
LIFIFLGCHDAMKMEFPLKFCNKTINSPYNPHHFLVWFNVKQNGQNSNKQSEIQGD